MSSNVLETPTVAAAIPYSQLTTLSDDELLAHHYAGNKLAFTALYLRNERGIGGELRKSYKLKHADADDVAQKVWDGIEKSTPNPHVNFGQLRSTLIKSRAIDFKRQKSGRKLRKHPASQTIVQCVGFEVIPDDLAALKDKLSEAMPTLTDKQQEAVKAVYFDGMTHNEAATKLGISVSSLNDRLDGAMKRLHSQMTAERSG